MAKQDTFIVSRLELRQILIALGVSEKNITSLLAAMDKAHRHTNIIIFANLLEKMGVDRDKMANLFRRMGMDDVSINNAFRMVDENKISAETGGSSKPLWISGETMKKSVCIMCAKEKDGLEIREDRVISGKMAEKECFQVGAEELQACGVQGRLPELQEEKGRLRKEADDIRRAGHTLHGDAARVLGRKVPWRDILRLCDDSFPVHDRAA